MSIVPLNIGSGPNDGTGQDLRSGGQVINDNFAELDQRATSAQATADAAVTNVQLQTGLDVKVDKIAGKGLSTEDFTTGEKNKLAGLQPAHYRGTFISLAALQAGVSTPVAGDYGDVDAGVGADVQRFIWDASDIKWVLQGASGGGPDNTDSLPEGSTNLYFSGARVLSAVLSGLSLLTGTPVVTTDTILVAVGKLQKQIGDLAGTVANKANKGANSDITAITGLTTPLALSQGGTGSASGVPDMVGASSSTVGTKGLVPAPSVGDLRFLASDGTWQTISTQKPYVSVKGFGDSNTVGLGLSSTAYNYINRESEIVKIPFVNNAVNSACTWDQAAQVYSTNLAVNECSQIMIGTNDSRRYGTVANDLDTFKRAHASLIAWLAIPELGKVRAANPLITYTGNWGDSAAYPTLTLKGSPAVGSVASFTFTGTTLYFSTARTNVSGTRATATVRIDGVVVGTVTAQGFSSNTIIGANYGPALYRFGGLSAGQHTVTITTVTADSQNLFFVEWFAVPDAANFSRPVNVLNVARQTAAGGGVDATTIAYNTAISDNVAMLVADGYRVNLADVFSTINPATDLQADGLHFNLQGHAKIAPVASLSLLKF
ncbi:hypothetical protein [Pseudomonas sp. GXZC]|uniref:hypothetical protein n=1 Tax=Pseudomonas sp. GXZC TaxID=3003351 RepID=UPI0022AA8020|nr:hypothetical protein [Pseudomonas sp. GXZC]WAT30170.1 hypothetical protein OZ428_07480 [Pseudomonas sp. GXZC]